MNIGKVATVREQLYGGFSTPQGRICGDMLCMCIDIGYGGTGEIRERSEDVLIYLQLIGPAASIQILLCLPGANLGLGRLGSCLGR